MNNQTVAVLLCGFLMFCVLYKDNTETKKENVQLKKDKLLCDSIASEANSRAYEYLEVGIALTNICNKCNKCKKAKDQLN